jgi:hypothetical protein
MSIFHEKKLFILYTSSNVRFIWNIQFVLGYQGVVVRFVSKLAFACENHLVSPTGACTYPRGLRAPPPISACTLMRGDTVVFILQAVQSLFTLVNDKGSNQQNMCNVGTSNAGCVCIGFIG